MSAAVVEGNGAVTGHIISTTIGGKMGSQKGWVIDFRANYTLSLYDFKNYRAKSRFQTFNFTHF